jgi:hypothetical protein
MPREKIRITAKKPEIKGKMGMSIIRERERERQRERESERERERKFCAKLGILSNKPRFSVSPSSWTYYTIPQKYLSSKKKVPGITS